jgi:hypothetical protein
MKPTRFVLLLAAALPLVAAAIPARAGDGGGFAAGLIGGAAAGALVGAAVSAPRYPPPPAYVAPLPVDGPDCYWTRGEPYWDGYHGVWIHPRVQVCE